MSDDLNKAIQVLTDGGVVAIPTETVYGLAARIDRPQAIEKIFQTKERPFFDPLIVHVSSIEQAKNLVRHWPRSAEILAKKFWPGPLTLVLPKSALINPMITSGLDSVGIRMPNHPLALEIIRQVGVPLAAPSANKFGRTSPTSAEHVSNEFKNENVFVVDGGPCHVGIESTVLLIRENNSEQILSILRKGHISQSDLSKALAEAQITSVFTDTHDKKESPGHMKHHYMPGIPFLLVQDEKLTSTDILTTANSRLLEIPDEVEKVKIIKPQGQLVHPIELKLSPDPAIATREFYARLRDCATSGADCIFFRTTANLKSERWEALLDRMTKAASLVL